MILSISSYYPPKSPASEINALWLSAVCIWHLERVNLFKAGEILIRHMQNYQLIFFVMVSSLIYTPTSVASVT